MKSEALIVLVVLLGVFGLGYRVARQLHTTPTVESTPAQPSPVDAAPPAVDGLTACLDARTAEQLKYVEWRGKHARELANCAASLEEATHALVRYRSDKQTHN